MDTDLEIRRYQKLEELEPLRQEWESLLAQIPTASIFNTWEWLSCWWRAFGAQQRLLVLAMHDSARHLVGLAPLAFRKMDGAPFGKIRIACLMGDGSADSDNLDILAKPGCERGVIAAMLGELHSQKSNWDVLQFNTVRSESACASELLRQVEGRGWTRFPASSTCRAIPLPETWEEYLKSLSYNERRNIRRYRDKLEKKYRVRVYRCSDVAEIPRCLESLFELHQKRWTGQGETGSFASAERRQLYQEVSRACLPLGRLEFWLLELDGKPVAAEFGFRYGAGDFVLQQGFDPDHYDDRVGNILRGHVIQNLISEGVRRYDFLGGGSQYKDRWYPEEGSYLNLDCALPRTRGALYLRATHGAAAAKEWLRGKLPARGWESLKRLRRSLTGGAAGGPATKPQAGLSAPAGEAAKGKHAEQAPLQE